MDDITPPKTIKTMDLTPTWESLVPVFRAVIEDGTPEAGEAMWAEITRMGKICDMQVLATNPPEFTVDAVYKVLVEADPTIQSMMPEGMPEEFAALGRSHVPAMVTSVLSVLLSGWAENNNNEEAKKPLDAMSAAFGANWPVAFLNADWRDHAEDLREQDPLEEMFKALAETGIQVVRL